MLRIRKGLEIFRQYRKQRGIKYRPPKEFRPPRAKCRRGGPRWTVDPLLQIYKFRLTSKNVLQPPKQTTLTRGSSVGNRQQDPIHIPHIQPKIYFLDIKKRYKTPPNNLNSRKRALVDGSSRITSLLGFFFITPHYRRSNLYQNPTEWSPVMVYTRSTIKIESDDRTTVLNFNKCLNKVYLFWKNKKISKVHLFLEYGQRPWMGIFVNKYYRSWRYESFGTQTYYYFRRKYINSGDALEPDGVVQSRKKTNPLDKKKKTWWRRNKKKRYIKEWWVYNKLIIRPRYRKIWGNKVYIKKSVGFFYKKKISLNKIKKTKYLKKKYIHWKKKYIHWQKNNNLKKKNNLKTIVAETRKELNRKNKTKKKRSKLIFYKKKLKKKFFLKIKKIRLRPPRLERGRRRLFSYSTHKLKKRIIKKKNKKKKIKKRLFKRKLVAALREGPKTTINLIESRKKNNQLVLHSIKKKKRKISLNFLRSVIAPIQNTITPTYKPKLGFNKKEDFVFVSMRKYTYSLKKKRVEKKNRIITRKLNFINLKISNYNRSAYFDSDLDESLISRWWASMTLKKTYKSVLYRSYLKLLDGVPNRVYYPTLWKGLPHRTYKKYKPIAFWWKLRKHTISYFKKKIKKKKKFRKIIKNVIKRIPTDYDLINRTLKVSKYKKNKRLRDMSSERIFRLKKKKQKQISIHTRALFKTSKSINMLPKNTLLLDPKPKYYKKINFRLKKKNFSKNIINVITGKVIIRGDAAAIYQNRNFYRIKNKPNINKENFFFKKIRLQLSYRLRRLKKKKKRTLRKFHILRKSHKFCPGMSDFYLKKIFNINTFKIFNLGLVLGKKQWTITKLKLFLSNVRMYEWGVPDDLGEPSEDLDESDLEVPLPKSDTTEHVMNLKDKYKNGKYERLFKDKTMELIKRRDLINKQTSFISYSPQQKTTDLATARCGLVATGGTFLNCIEQGGVVLWDPDTELEPKEKRIWSIKFKKKKRRSSLRAKLTLYIKNQKTTMLYYSKKIWIIYNKLWQPITPDSTPLYQFKNKFSFFLIKTHDYGKRTYNSLGKLPKSDGKRTKIHEHMYWNFVFREPFIFKLGQKKYIHISTRNWKLSGKSVLKLKKKKINFFFLKKNIKNTQLGIFKFRREILFRWYWRKTITFKKFI